MRRFAIKMSLSVLAPGVIAWCLHERCEAAGSTQAAKASKASMTAAEVLKRADEVRNPSDSYLIQVEVSTEGESAITKMDVAIKGGNRTHVTVTGPEAERGKKMLMIDEDMWVMMAKKKRQERPVRVSLNQKLTGQAANGDITRQRWSGDYQPVLESETPKEWVLNMTALRKGLTYERIQLAVEKKTFHPIRAAYMTKSGKVLKRAEFGDYRMQEGRLRPMRTTITSATQASDRSVISVTKIASQEFPDSLFDQNNLSARGS